MTKYRRKLLEVEAVRWDGTAASADLCRLLAGQSFEVLDGFLWEDDPAVTAICRSDLLGGKWMGMYPGDYVVVDDEGRLFPLRAVIFEEMYESWGA